MSRVPLVVATTALAFFAASALAQGSGQLDLRMTVLPLDVRATMQDRINPAMLAIWDVGNNALDDEGGIDPAQMDDAKWAKVAEAAGQLSAASTDIAAASAFVAAAPDSTEVGEGEITMAAVQQHLDRDPAGLKQMAAALADHADNIAAAARARDARAMGDLIGETDGVCENCHSTYWYAE